MCLTAALIMSVMQKLISPLTSSSAEPPRNKVTVVGVGQVGMACAISILLRVRRCDNTETQLPERKRMELKNVCNVLLTELLSHNLSCKYIENLICK